MIAQCVEAPIAEVYATYVDPALDGDKDGAAAIGQTLENLVLAGIGGLGIVAAGIWFLWVGWKLWRPSVRAAGAAGGN